MRAAADAASQLVQLSQTEPLAVFDGHHRRVRHVDADFDDRGGHQHLGLAPLKASMTDSFSAALMLAVNQVQPKLLQFAVGQRFERLLHAGHRGSSSSASTCGAIT